MREIVLLVIALFAFNIVGAQSKADTEAVEQACLGYLEGFYEGDTTKIISSLRPTLHKYGFWKKKGSDVYEYDSAMTFQEAKDYAKSVKEKKHFPKPDAPKIVEVLDVMHHIAAAKVTAWWGVDYLLLSKNEGKWMIEQVIWEGPLER